MQGERVEKGEERHDEEVAVMQLNPTAASLLGFLHDRPQSGWDLMVTAELVIGDFWSITRSQVYRELAKMEEAGLVRAGAVEARERRPYELTDAGRRAFAEWVNTEPGPEQIRYPLLLRIAFGRHVAPDRLVEMVRAHRVAHAERLARYRELEADLDPEVDPYTAARLDFGIRYETAVLEWFDALPWR